MSAHEGRPVVAGGDKPEQSPPDEPPPKDAAGAASAHREAVRTSVTNASKLTMAMAITIPLGFVGRILIPRFLGSEKAGVLFFAESFPVLLLTFLPLGIPSYIAKTVPPRHEHAAEILSPILRIELLLGVLLTMALMVFMTVTHYPTPIIVLTGIMAGYQTLFMLTTEILQPLLLAIGQINFTSVLNVGAKVFVTASLLACLLLSGSLTGLALVFLVTQAAIVMVILGKAKRLGLTGHGNTVAKMWPVIWVSLPFFAGSLLSRSSGSVDIALLSRLGSYEEVGYYGAVQRLQGLFMMLVPIVSNALVPVLSRAFGHDKAQYRDLAGSAARALAILAFPLSAGMTAFASEIILVVYGTGFAPAARVLMIDGPLLLLTYVTTFIAMNVVITTDGRGMAGALFIGFVLNALFDALFIPLGMRYIGVGGGAAGALLSTLVVEVVIMVFLLRAAKATQFSRRTLLTFAAAVAPSVALIALGDRWTLLPLPIRIAAFVVGAPAYFFMSRMATVAEIVAFAKMLRNRGKQASA